MRALPFLLALAIAVLLAQPTLRALRVGGHTRPNYRGRELPYPLGVLIVVAALLALVPLTLIERVGAHRDPVSGADSRSRCTRSGSPAWA